MFNPNDQSLLPLLAIRSAFDASDLSTSPRFPSVRRGFRRPRPNIVRLIPGITKLPIGYSAR